MQTMTYPVNGDLSRNVKITILPTWMEVFLGDGNLLIPAFRRLWMSPHAKAYVSGADDLVRFNGHIAYAYRLLQEQQAFPVGGIGWWIERFADINTAMEQDIEAFAWCYSQISPGNSLWSACARKAEHYHLALGAEFHGFFVRINDRAKVLAEAGGI